MNNTYIVEKDNIKTVLDEIDNFKSRMDTFIQENPNYHYSASIHENTNKRSKNKWVVELNITTDESKDT